MRPRFPIVLATLAASATAQVQEGDLLFNRREPGTLAHYRPDGTLVAQAGGGLEAWEGAALTPGGRWVTTSVTPREIVVFGQTGVELTRIPTPEVEGAGDIAVFADGTFAAADQQSGEIELYTPLGVHERTIDLPPISRPNGLMVDLNDDLWVSDTNGGYLLRYTRQGYLLVVIDPGVDFPMDLDAARDGTVWTIGYEGTAERYATDGTLLGAFSTGVVNPTAIAAAPDGTVWIAGAGNAMLHFDASGALLGSFPTIGDVLFLAVARGNLGVRFCNPARFNSTGYPALIELAGSPAVAQGELTLAAIGLPPDEFGYFLVGAATGLASPPGSQGALCLAGSLGRYASPAAIVTGPSGRLAVDLARLPFSPPVAVVPGDSWFFQCWYRDGGSSNFTDAVSIAFR